MKRLKVLLQSEASKYIHLAIVISLLIGSERSRFLLLLFFIELLFLAKKAKNFFIISILVLLCFQIRCDLSEQKMTLLTQTEIQGRVISVKTNGMIINDSGRRIMVYTHDIENWLPGDIVTMEGSPFLSEVHHIEHVFDYQEYLLSINVTSEFYATKITKVSHQFDIREIEYRILSILRNRYSGKEFSYLSMLVFGNDDSMDESMVFAFREIGIAHLFAISGMHVGMIILALEWVLSHFYIKEKTKNAFVISFLIAYNIITGFLISVIRASLQTIIILVNKKQQWFFSKSDLLSFSYVAFLFYSPHLLYQSGFQLSYFIAFALILGQDLFKNASSLSKIVKVNLLAIAFSLPIILEMNKSWGLISLISGVVFLFLVSYLFLPLSFFTILIPKLATVYRFLIDGFEKLIQLFSRFNLQVVFNFPSLALAFGYYAGVYFYLSAVILKKSRKKALLVLLIVIFMSLSLPNNPLVSKVVFLDVGQGDASYLQSGSCNILIDTGSSDDYDSVIAYLLGENITRLDAIFITHFHEDHYGEVTDIQSQIKVDHLYANATQLEFPSIEVLKEDDVISCGSLVIDVLHGYTGASNENNNSLVIKVSIQQDSYLFMGDIEEFEENSIIENHAFTADIMKIGHHGSDTSSSQALLDAFSPTIAIVSVGKNDYGHPSQSVLQMLEEKRISVYRTDCSGSITILYIRGIKLRFISTSNDRFHLFGG